MFVQAGKVGGNRSAQLLYSNDPLILDLDLNAERRSHGWVTLRREIKQHAIKLTKIIFFKFVCSDYVGYIIFSIITIRDSNLDLFYMTSISQLKLYSFDKKKIPLHNLLLCAKVIF